MTNKRIYNPVTKKYYIVKSKTTKRGKVGQIKGLWDKVHHEDKGQDNG